MDLGEVVARDAKEDVGGNRRQGLHQHQLPGKGEEQDRRDQQVGHEQAQDQADGPAHQQIGGHRAHLLHQPAPQPLEDNPRQEARQGAAAAEDPAQLLQVLDAD